MQCNISSLQIPMTKALEYHISACFKILLLCFENRVRGVQVRLSALNDPKDGKNKICCLQADMDEHPSIDTEGRHADIYIAITLAFVRMQRSLSRLLDGTRIRNSFSRRNSTFGTSSPESDGPFSHSDR